MTALDLMIDSNTNQEEPIAKPWRHSSQQRPRAKYYVVIPAAVTNCKVSSPSPSPASPPSSSKTSAAITYGATTAAAAGAGAVRTHVPVSVPVPGMCTTTTVIRDLLLAGYKPLDQIATTLQGCIFTARYIGEDENSIASATASSSASQPALPFVVIKQTSKLLHRTRTSKTNRRTGKRYSVGEDIVKEAAIMKRINEEMPKNNVVRNSMVKYLDFFESATNYFLVMEYSGADFFSFVSAAHANIKLNKVRVKKWRKYVKFFMWQLCLFLNWLHGNRTSRVRCCHLDISMENILIMNAEWIPDPNDDGFLILDHAKHIYLKLCDWGLSEMYPNTSANDAGLSANANQSPIKENSVGEQNKNAHENQRSRRSVVEEQIDDDSMFLCNKYCGKVRYLSPEIARRKKDFHANKSDVWSLGVVFFAMTFGAMPYKSPDLANDACFQYIANGGLLQLLQHWKCVSLISNHMFHLLKNMLVYEESKRYTIEQVLFHTWFATYMKCYHRYICF